MVADKKYDVIVVGGGFGGVYQLYQLRKLGYNVRLLDSGSSLGGIWYWNCYPGARVDSDIPLYEFSIEELWRDWTWTERFPGQKELAKYFEYVDKKLDITKDCTFNTYVEGADWDDAASVWNIKTRGGDMYQAKYFVLCTGFASKRHVPDFKGLDKFKGICSHTAVWPQEGVDVKGKRVGVVGTGASGVQTIQEVGPDVAHLVVFQRTPNLALPMQQQKLDAATQNRNKAAYPDIYQLRKRTFAGFHYDFAQRDTNTDTPEKRKEFYDQLYKNGGFQFWLATYKDMLFSQEANDHAYNYWRDATRARLHDPKVAEILAPTKPPHAFGTKRPCLEQRYYEVFNQKNVEVVSLPDNPIAEITETGVKMQDGKFYELDVLALATGFDAITGGITQIDVRDTNGVTFKERWSQGVYTYLGMATSGFPNLFYLYGPQGPTAFCNGPTCAEIQGDWIIDTINHMEKNKLKKIEADPAAELEYRNHVSNLVNRTLFPNTKSWYMGANIPGKPRESLNFTGGVPLYRKEIGECAENGYKGFHLS